MKRVLAVLVLATLVIAATTRPPLPPTARALALPQLVSLTLSWEYPPSELSNDIVFRVYHTTNIVTPDWQIITNVLGGKTNVIVQALPGYHYYSVASYSVFWGQESSFSSVTSTPPAPRSDLNLTIGKP